MTRKGLPLVDAREWSVAIELATSIGAGAQGADRIDDLLEALGDDVFPVASYDETTLVLRLTVRAPDPAAACSEVTRVVTEALKDATDEREAGRAIRHIEADSLEALDRRINESDAPEIVGVAEVAELLGVTKQRVSELARSLSFPSPAAELASGPVWHKRDLARHVGHWPRRPGRPRKIEAPPPLPPGVTG